MSAADRRPYSNHSLALADWWSNRSVTSGCCAVLVHPIKPNKVRAHYRIWAFWDKNSNKQAGEVAAHMQRVGWFLKLITMLLTMVIKKWTVDLRTCVPILQSQSSISTHGVLFSTSGELFFWKRKLLGKQLTLSRSRTVSGIRSWLRLGNRSHRCRMWNPFLTGLCWLLG